MNFIIDIIVFLNKHLDKIAHMFFGLILSFITFYIFRNYTFTFMCIFVIAYIKQYLDVKLFNKNFDIYDLCSTLFGGILGLLMWVVK